MEKILLDQFSKCVEEGISNCLKNNPGIEKKIDWFTVLADQNIQIEKICESEQTVLMQ